MDPNATYEALDRALAAGDREEALGTLEALTGWIRSGGFLPFPLEGVDGEDATPITLVCTSDNPLDHQGDTCPIHEA